jgi:NADPH2:quinone reductase
MAPGATPRADGHRSERKELTSRCTIEPVRAVIIPEFGDSRVLKVSDVPEPEPGPGQVSIAVAFAGINYAEVLYRRGVVPVPLPFVPGIEVSGHVKALGEGVQGLSVGQPVAALTIVDSGGYAETVVTDARLAVPLDVAVAGGGLAGDLARAAAVPSNTTTALLVLERVARLTRGESVLIHAAAGGVGSQLGQVAQMMGAAPTAGVVGTADKAEVAKSLGYDRVLLREDLRRLPPGDEHFDVAVDMVGGAAREWSLQALNPLGRLVVMGNASGAEDVPLSSNQLWFRSATASGFNLAQISAADPALVGSTLARALTAVDDGTVRVELSGEVAMSEIAQAHEVLEQGTGTGKLVLRVAA